MPNRFAGTCYRCGKIVAPGEGVFERVGHRQKRKFNYQLKERWLTQHHECAIEWRGTAHHYLYNDLRNKEDAE